MIKIEVDRCNLEKHYKKYRSVSYKLYKMLSNLKYL